MRLLPLTLLGLIISAGAQSNSQPAAQPNIMNALLEETQIRSGMAGQFEAAQKDYCAAVVKGGAPACLIFSTSTFGQSDRYFTVLPFASFIHYDQGKYTEKGLTPDEAKALSARRVPPIESNHESAIALHKDLSILPTVSNADYPINFFVEYHLRPGTSAEFLNGVRDYLLPAARQANLLEFEVFTTTVGESPDRVLIVTRLKNFATLDQGNPIKSMLSGHAEEMFRDLLTKTVEHRDTCIMRYRGDLSTDPRKQH